MKVLVVEDDAKLARFLTRVLVEEGFEVESVASGALGASEAQKGGYGLVVLDWMLPDKDGLAVCEELRRAGVSSPILMLTGRGETRDRVQGLDAGADDYMVKPFEVEEFVARVRALLRRAAPAAEARLRRGPLEIDRMGQKVTAGGVGIALTSREFALLVHLAQHTDRVVTRAEILAEVWGTKFDPGTNIVEVHVSRLRDKLGEHSWMVETARGVGYRLKTTP